MKTNDVVLLSDDGLVRLIINRTEQRRVIGYAVQEFCAGVWFTISSHPDLESAQSQFISWSEV